MAWLGGGGRNRGTRADKDTEQTFFRSVMNASQRNVYLTLCDSESLTSELGNVSNTNVSPYDAAFPGTLPVRVVCYVTPRARF